MEHSKKKMLRKTLFESLVFMSDYVHVESRRALSFHRHHFPSFVLFFFSFSSSSPISNFVCNRSKCANCTYSDTCMIHIGTIREEKSTMFLIMSRRDLLLFLSLFASLVHFHRSRKKWRKRNFDVGDWITIGNIFMWLCTVGTGIHLFKLRTDANVNENENEIKGKKKV